MAPNETLEFAIQFIGRNTIIIPSNAFYLHRSRSDSVPLQNFLSSWYGYTLQLE